MQEAVAEFRVGEVIGTSFSVLFRNIVPFGALALIFHSPLLLVGGAAFGFGAEGFAAGAVIGMLLWVVLTFAVYGALVFGTTEDLRGRPVGMADCVKRGFATLLPVLGVTILAGLGIGLGMMLLIVPGIILAVMWWVAFPAAVIERPGIVAALSRSSALTKGHRWGVFGIVILLWLGGAIANGIVGFIAGDAGIASSLLSVIVQAFFAALGAVVAAVGYYRLRAEKEGVYVEELAKVFD